MNVLAIHPPKDRPKQLVFPNEEEGRITLDSEYVPGPWDAVMFWGTTERGRSPIAAEWVLNPPDALKDALDSERTVERLRAHGIRTRYFGRTGRYRVHVFDLRVLGVYRRSGKKFRRIYSSSKRMRAVRAMAVRCIYALGLHFGSVDVISLSKDVAVPTRVDPTPALTKVTGRLYARSAANFVLRKRARLDSERKPVTLGADIEFIMRRGKQIIYASRYFSRYGRVGYDQQGSRYRRGAKPIVEVRPSPSSDPIELVANIKDLLRRAARRAPKKGVRWQAGSLPVRRYPIGGHIHFSNVALTTDLLRALDNYLALPLAMLEDPERARRRRPRYGYLGEFRWQRHGFEYRVPSSWIVTPEFAYAVCCLAKLVAENYERLTLNPFADNEVCRAFYRSDKRGMRAAFEAVWSDLETLPDYERLEEHLRIIPEWVREGKEWSEARDFRTEWGLVRRRPRKARRR